MNTAKDFTQPKRGALNRSGRTVDTTKPQWKARIGRAFTRATTNIKSFTVKRG